MYATEIQADWLSPPREQAKRWTEVGRLIRRKDLLTALELVRDATVELVTRIEMEHGEHAVQALDHERAKGRSGMTQEDMTKVMRRALERTCVCRPGRANRKTWLGHCPACTLYQLQMETIAP